MDGYKQPGLPQKGWNLVTVEDNEDLSDNCHMCGTDIRYVHFLRHPDYPEEIGVGCICAEKLTEDYVRPRKLQKALEAKDRRIARYRKKKWEVNEKGNFTLKYKSCRITVFQNRFGTIKGTWGFYVDGCKRQWSFEDSDGAKLHSLKTVDELKSKKN